MNRFQSFRSVLLLSCLSFMVSGLFAQQGELGGPSKMYLVLMDMESELDISLCYSKKFDKDYVKIEFAYEDTINYLSDYIYHEDPLAGPECFVPEIKLVYKSHTYIISLYCGKVIKYRNSTPWITSPSRVKNDLIITQSVYNYLHNLRLKHFGDAAHNQKYLSGIMTGESLDSYYDDTKELDLLLQEDFLEDDDEKDLEIDGPARALPDEDIDDEDYEIEEDGDGRG